MLVRSEDFPRWIDDCAVENVRITGISSKHGQSYAVRLCRALRAKVKVRAQGNERKATANGKRPL